VLASGTCELPELQRQSDAYHAARKAANLPSERFPLIGHDHFSILEELANPDGQLTDYACRLASFAYTRKRDTTFEKVPVITTTPASGRPHDKTSH
jgi:hypothetical protein